MQVSCRHWSAKIGVVFFIQGRRTKMEKIRIEVDKVILYYKELQELWDKLGDIPVNNDDEIEEDFLNFPAGTSKFDVWHWFDERCPNGVAEDLMYNEENEYN